MSVERFAAGLAGRFGSKVVLEASALDGTELDLYPEERAAVPHAKEKRLREFATGRRLAHQALARLGFPATPLPMREDRRPDWPPGLLASISHTHGICVVVAAHQGELELLGVDVERDQDLAEHIFPTILTARERAVVEAAEPEARGRLALAYFSAKECLYKAQYPRTETFLEFQDVELELSGDRFSARVSRPEAARHLPATLEGFLFRSEGWLAAGLAKP